MIQGMPGAEGFSGKPVLATVAKGNTEIKKMHCSELALWEFFLNNSGFIKPAIKTKPVTTK